MALFSGDGWLFLLRWLHFLAGITWIGMLYYFNFVQTPFFATAEAPVRTGMVAGGLVDRALWWFRWGAMITFITGWLYLLHLAFARYGGIGGFFADAYGFKIIYGGLLGTVMWFNVWFVIWPAQRKILPAVRDGATVDPALPKKALRASRANAYMSGPMLFGMLAPNHFGGFDIVSGAVAIALGLVAIWWALGQASSAGTDIATPPSAKT